jgi:putative spermidine/putrescine transport system substrate-binding protein
MVFPGTQGTGFLVMAAKVHGGDERNINAGFDALKRLKPFFGIMSGIDESNLAFEQGDIWLMPQIAGYVYAFKAEGGHVDFAIPKEGGVLSMNFAAISKNSKNADLAEIFINYHLSQPCQEAYVRDLYYGPTNEKITLPANLRSLVVSGADQIAKLVAFDNAYISEHNAEWTDKWNKEILE